MSDMTRTPFQPMLDPAMRTIDVGNVFRLTYATFRRKPWTFIGLSLLPFLFTLLASGAQFTATMNKDLATAAWTAFGLITLIQYVFILVTYAAMIYGAARLLAGSTFTAGEAIRVGLRRFFPFLGLAILVGLIVLVGTILLIVPGIIVAFMLAAAIQVCIIEGRGPIDSIKRSMFLTKGNKWRIFLSYLLTIVAPMIAVYLVTIVLSVIVVFGANAIFGQSPAVMIVAGIISFLPLLLFFLVIFSITQIVLAVIFVELRRVKEGTAQEGVAQVFD